MHAIFVMIIFFLYRLTLNKKYKYWTCSPLPISQYLLSLHHTFALTAVTNLVY